LYLHIGLLLKCKKTKDKNGTYTLALFILVHVLLPYGSQRMRSEKPIFAPL